MRERERFWVYIYSIPPSWPGCDTRSIFKQSKASLISELFFSYIGCLIKAKEFSLLYYLFKAGLVWFYGTSTIVGY